IRSPLVMTQYVSVLVGMQSCPPLPLLSSIASTLQERRDFCAVTSGRVGFTSSMMRQSPSVIVSGSIVRDLTPALVGMLPCAVQAPFQGAGGSKGSEIPLRSWQIAVLAVSVEGSAQAPSGCLQGHVHWLGRIG